MNYDAFNALTREAIAAMDTEQRQAHMEHVLREACQIDTAHPRILDKMAPEFISCDAQAMQAEIRFFVEDWMCNVKGTLHGGIIATMLDNSMGLLTRAFYGNSDKISTINLSLSYLRPVLPGKSVTATVRIEKPGRNIVFLYATLTTQEGKPAAAASGTFNV